MANPPVKPNTYQWVKTERIGELVTVSHEDDGFLVFTDGTRCSKKLQKEMYFLIKKI